MLILLLLPSLSYAISSIPIYGTPPVQGNFGNRAASTALCLNAKPDTIVCSSTLAIISYQGDPAYAIGDPHNSLPISNSVGTVLASNWSVLWDVGLELDLFSAEVVTKRTYFTGTEGSGVLSQRNCQDWTALTGTARVGEWLQTDARWMSYGDMYCDYPRPILCLCAPATLNPTPYPTPPPTKEPTEE